MADQVLSQEEIDALLSAMDKGEVDLKQDAPAQEVVREYNLTSRNTLLRSQFHGLEEVCDRFATRLSVGLSTSLQQSIEVEPVSTEMVKYGEFINIFSTPTHLSIFTLEPLIGEAMMAIQPQLVFSLIDCMFGGPGKPLGRTREFTLIEQRMMKKFAAEALAGLQEAWSVVHKVKIGLRRSESKPEFVRLAGANDLMVIIVFGVKGEAFTGNIHLCLSYLTLEPIKDILAATERHEKDSQPAWHDQLRRLLKDTPVNIIAELGQTSRTVGEVLKLQVDDVLHLPSGPKDQIVLKVDGVPKFFGFPGIIKGNRAVEITRLVDR
ncbi:MAG: flagellar motor switch protein FliM [Desulfobacterales bacterium]